MLLGIASLRASTKLYYDAPDMRVTNNAAANQFLTREQQEGVGTIRVPSDGCQSARGAVASAFRRKIHVPKRATCYVLRATCDWRLATGNWRLVTGYW